MHPAFQAERTGVTYRTKGWGALLPLPSRERDRGEGPLSPQRPRKRKRGAKPPENGPENREKN
jgi:hypothetical protein